MGYISYRCFKRNLNDGELGLPPRKDSLGVKRTSKHQTTGTFQFSLNVFIEFSDFSHKIFVIAVKGLEPATQPSFALGTSMLPQRQQDTCERQDI